MGSVKFQKGSEEWMMFMEYWALCQKYWIPEKDDAWWDEANEEIMAFQRKYGMTAFVRGLGLALAYHHEAYPAEHGQPGRKT